MNVCKADVYIYFARCRVYITVLALQYNVLPLSIPILPLTAFVKSLSLLWPTDRKVQTRTKMF